jgi:hypothetical protein
MGEVCPDLARPIFRSIITYVVCPHHARSIYMDNQSDIHTITEIGLSMASEP